MGLFGNSKRNSGEGGSDAKSVSSSGSREVSRKVGSQSSAAVPNPPRRRIRLPRQVTTDHIAPPPMRDGEIDAFKSQIDDLSRCTDNPGIFELLLSDIDRNRLTQMTMILAEKGDYPTMARVMELTDNLDRLIREQVDEVHKRQRLSLRSSSQSNLSLDDFLNEADAIAADSNLSAAALRAKIQTFDQCYSQFQDAPFDRLILLSDKVEILRNKLLALTRPDVQPILPSPPMSPESWVNFEAPQGDPSPVSPLREKDSGPVSPSNAEIRVADSNEAEPTAAASGTHAVKETAAEMQETMEAEALEVEFTPPNNQVVESAATWNTFQSEPVNHSVQEPWDTFSNPGIESPEPPKPSIEEPKPEQGPISFSEADVPPLGISASVPVIVTHQAAADDTSHNEELQTPKVEAVDAVVEGHLRFKRIRLLRIIMTVWVNCASETVEWDRSKTKRILKAWRARTHALVAAKREANISLKAWYNMRTDTRAKEEMLVAQRIRMMGGPIISAWHITTLDIKNKLFGFETAVRERAQASTFKAWYELTCSVLMNKELQSSFEKMGLNTVSNELESSFEEVGVHTENADPVRDLTKDEPGCTELERSHTYSRNLSRVAFQAWRDATSTQGESVSPLRVFGILATEPEDAPTSPEAWLEELPEGIDEAPDDSRASLPDSVEHYIIHDSPPAQPSADFRTQTEDIIARAQMFLSQRHLNAQRLKVPIVYRPVLTQSVNVDLQPHPESDKYFSWFDRKWSDEEKRWRI